MLSSSPICKLLNIKYPILQGGMAWIADAKLAAAVSQAGGLGIIAAMNSRGEEVRTQIKRLRSLTDKSFGVNIMLMSRYAEEVAKVVVEEKVPVLTTGAGNPSKFMKMWLSAGIKVIPVIPSVSYAKLMQRAGASAVIAEGYEAGGHIGEITTMCLVPQVVDAVDIPVIAAGGIADGRAVAASFMLGASGVQVGTRFLASKECNIHPNYKSLVLSAGDNQTIVTGRRLGHPIRALKTKMTRDFFAKEKDPSVADQELEKANSGALRCAVQDGDLDKGCFMAGQCAGMVKQELSAKEIIESMFYKAEELLKGTNLWAKLQ